MCKIGKVYVIGLGPGAEKEMTYQASTALEKSEVIIGYTVYTGLIRERFPDKKYLSTPMRQEVIRCEMAMDEAMKGSTVAMVCSGDAGVYGSMRWDRATRRWSWRSCRGLRRQMAVRQFLVHL